MVFSFTTNKHLYFDFDKSIVSYLFCLIFLFVWLSYIVFEHLTEKLFAYLLFNAIELFAVNIFYLYWASPLVLNLNLVNGPIYNFKNSYSMISQPSWKNSTFFLIIWLLIFMSVIILIATFFKILLEN